MAFAAGSFSAWGWSGLAPAHYKIESITECIFGNSNFDIKFGYQSFARRTVGDAVEDRVEGQKRIAGKIHLSSEASGETRTEQTEVNMIWPPSIVMIAPRIRARLDRHEAVRAVRVRDHSSDTGEMRIERRLVLILGVSVAAGGVRLPNFDHGVR